MDNEEVNEKSQNEVKHELISAWSVYLWESLDEKLDSILSD